MAEVGSEDAEFTAEFSWGVIEPWGGSGFGEGRQVWLG